MPASDHKPIRYSGGSIYVQANGRHMAHVCYGHRQHCKGAKNGADNDRGFGT
jgi:hypothetical protein